LPITSNTYSKNTINEKVIWLGPDEWLIVSDDDDAFIKLQNKIGNLEASVTDVSENRTIIRIRGKKTYVLLSKFLVLIWASTAQTAIDTKRGYLYSKTNRNR